MPGSYARGQATSLGAAPDGPRETTLHYVAHFYPRWFTYYQENFTATNRLVGPNRMTPLYSIVVAPNDDTIYVSSFIDVTAEPIVLKIPPTTLDYSLLILDVYGNIYSNLPIQPTEEGGLYALTGPNWTGTLPDGVSQVPLPVNVTNWIIRADKYDHGNNQEGQAELFREAISEGTLTEYETTGLTPAAIVPVELADRPFKQIADDLCQNHPIKFLEQLQTAVMSPGTPPFTADEHALSDRFNTLFAARKGNLEPFEKGTREAHSSILADYVTHVGTNNWIHFTNIGNWTPEADLDRSAIAEFIEYGNGINTAAYYQTFKDSKGKPLNGEKGKGYVMTFPAGQTPPTDRFWSVTAYLPKSITLVPNEANQYVVASYTPGLVTNSDGSTSIYMFTDLPDGVPPNNWLPIPRGKFNIMLRDYGPTGSASDNTYVPPPIVATKVKQLSN